MFYCVCFFPSARKDDFKPVLGLVDHAFHRYPELFFQPSPSFPARAFSRVLPLAIDPDARCG